MKQIFKYFIITLTLIIVASTKFVQLNYKDQYEQVNIL
jgi:hypothetical protein